MPTGGPPSSPIVQPGVVGSIPVINRIPPPEGQMAAQIPIQFNPAQFSYANVFPFLARSS